MKYILDHGAYSLKIGDNIDSNYQIIKNYIVKSKYAKGVNYIGNDYKHIIDKTSISYTYPFQRGYLVNWNVQKEIWDYLFDSDPPMYKIEDGSLIVTEPIANFESIKECFAEVFFEDYKLRQLYITTAPQMAFHQYCAFTNSNSSDSCSLIVDCGFSFTHIVPIIGGKIYTDAIIRIDVGGKILTNYLKDIVSYRQLNILHETYIANQMKEDVCRVSLNFNREIENVSKKPVYYQLPDFHSIQRGILTENVPIYNPSESQILSIKTESITIPEILFNPSIIGINQIGISQGIQHCINLTPYDIQPHLYSNIVLIGGSTNFPSLKERIYNDLRTSTLEYLDINITSSNNPIIYPWKGGLIMSQTLEESNYISKEKYNEEGPSRIRNYFKKANYFEKNPVDILIK